MFDTGVRWVGGGLHSRKSVRKGNYTMNGIQKILMIVVGIILLAFGVQRGCLADDPDDHVASFLSNSITTPYLVLGEISLLSRNSADGKQAAVQGAKALLATCLATEAIKFAVHEERPGSESRTSFPSGHTSSVFAMATVIGDYKPKYRLLAYGTAAAIGWSRVETGSHYTHDVIAGAVLGHLVAKHFTNGHIVPTVDGLSFKWKF